MADGDTNTAGGDQTTTQAQTTGGDQTTTQAQTTVGDQTTTQTPVASEFMNSMSPDVRAALAPKGFAMPDDIGRAYLELEKVIGKRGVTVPGENASDEERSTFYNALGRPEKPDGYDLSGFTPPEGLPWSADVQGAVVAKLHARGLTQAQMAGAMQDYAEVQGEAFEALQTELKAKVASDTAALKKELGAAWEAKNALMNRVAREAFGENLEAATKLQLMDGSFLLDHPMVARAFMGLGGRLAEDGVWPDGGAVVATSPAAAQAEIETLERNPDTAKALMDSSHPEHKAMVERRARLYHIAYPERTFQ